MTKFKVRAEWYKRNPSDFYDTIGEAVKVQEFEVEARNEDEAKKQAITFARAQATQDMMVYAGLFPPRPLRLR